MRAKLKEGEDQADRVSGLLDDAEKALREKDPDPAERKLREADEILQRPEIGTNPDAEMLKDRLHALQPQVAQVRAEKEREELAKRIAHRREVIAASVKTFRRAIVELEKNTADRAAIEAARKAANQMDADLDWERELQDRDAEFKEYVASLKIDVKDAGKELALAERAVEFADGPVKDRDEAEAATAKAREQKVAAERLKLYLAAQEAYARCADRGGKLIEANPGLDKAALSSGAKPSTAGAITRACAEEEKATVKLAAATQKLADADAKAAAKAEKAREKAAAAAAAKKKKPAAHAHK